MKMPKRIVIELEGDDELAAAFELAMENRSRVVGIELTPSQFAKIVAKETVMALARQSQ